MSGKKLKIENETNKLRSLCPSVVLLLLLLSSFASVSSFLGQKISAEELRLPGIDEINRAADAELQLPGVDQIEREAEEGLDLPSVCEILGTCDYGGGYP